MRNKRKKEWKKELKIKKEKIKNFIFDEAKMVPMKTSDDQFLLLQGKVSNLLIKQKLK